MSSYIYLIVVVAVILGLLVFSARARRRQAALQAERSDRIQVGTEVMTTSGLYGTVVARNDDETVQLAIAPGVEVKWALAALRDFETLPMEYRGGIEDDRPADAEGAEPAS